MITMIPGGRINVYFGLSTDTKPDTHVPNGSVYYEMDSGNVFFYDQDNAQWRQKQ